MKSSNLLTKPQMEKLTTERLMAYRGSLLACNEGPGDDPEDTEKELTKDSSMWQGAYDQLKEVLSEREHVVKK